MATHPMVAWMTGLALGVSGTLMLAASAQRWAGACAWGDGDAATCLVRQDHLYDFIAPTAPWHPVGAAATLAAWSMLALALAVLALPQALLGRRPGFVTLAATLATVLTVTNAGVATLRSSAAGVVVPPLAGGATLLAWVLLPPALFIGLAVAAQGSARAAALSLVMASPLVAGFTYAVGSYDARPWWEAVSGLLTVVAGGVLTAGAVRGHPPTIAADEPAVMSSPNTTPAA
ncbi:MAG: hypothetical protein KDB63_06220 [Nocardioidaceae bacterium]|nr:hypothetical protein [Nocardioidaceae bacterium]